MNNFSNIEKQITELIRNKLKELRIDASGNLSRSISTEVVFSGEVYEINISLEDYWKFVENGRRPGKFPPLDQIKSWIFAKHLIPKPINGIIPTQDSQAFLIGRKISKKGTKATHFLERTIESPAFERLMEELEDLIIKEITKDLNTQIDKL